MSLVKVSFSSLSRRSSFSEEQAQLSRRLKELQRRHNEFRRLLLGGQGPYSAGPAFLTSSHTPFLLLGSEGLLSNIPVSIPINERRDLHQAVLWMDDNNCVNGWR